MHKIERWEMHLSACIAEWQNKEFAVPDTDCLAFSMAAMRSMYGDIPEWNTDDFVYKNEEEAKALMKSLGQYNDILTERLGILPSKLFPKRGDLVMTRCRALGVMDVTACWFMQPKGLTRLPPTEIYLRWDL